MLQKLKQEFEEKILSFDQAVEGELINILSDALAKVEALKAKSAALNLSLSETSPDVEPVTPPVSTEPAVEPSSEVSPSASVEVTPAVESVASTEASS